MNSGQTKLRVISRAALQNIPKVELHRHLECSMRFSTFLELAEIAGIQVPADLNEARENFLVTSPMKDLGSVLNKFLHVQKVIGSPAALTRITYEIIEDAVKEGIRILELRYAPTFITETHPHLNFEIVHAAILKGMKQAEHFPIAVGLIATIQRIKPVSEAQAVLDFVLKNRDTFVGLDLADNEDGFEPEIFKTIFERAKSEHLPITVHAGEASIPRAAENVRSSIEILGASRIGHGLQIINDPSVMALCRDRGIPLELCPTSNYLTQAIPSLKDHPIRKLMEAGVPVTINSDDPGVFDIDLVNEYEVLSGLYNFTEAEFDKCNDIAAQASFIPLVKKQKYWPRPIHNLR